MKKYAVIICAMALCAACGDNKTKEKVINGTVVSATSSSGAGTGTNTVASNTAKTATVTSNAASMAGTVASSLGSFAPGQYGSPSLRKSIGTVPDSEGYFSYSGYSSTIKIRFEKQNGTVITNLQSADMLALYRLRVKISTTYAFGTFSGVFSILYNSGSTDDTLETGTIDCSDPVGGTFHADFTGLTIAKISSGSSTIGVPKSGHMDITASTLGYTGSFDYSTSGLNRLCTGTITNNSVQVATVALQLNMSVMNYTGTYTDSTGTHAIDAK